MEREVVSKDAIRRLNGLSWDKKRYANFFGTGNKCWLECNFYLGDEGYHYRVDCDSERDLNRLRAELDSNCYLNDNGFCVSKH